MVVIQLFVGLSKGSNSSPFKSRSCCQILGGTKKKMRCYTFWMLKQKTLDSGKLKRQISQVFVSSRKQLRKRKLQKASQDFLVKSLKELRILNLVSCLIRPIHTSDFFKIRIVFMFGKCYEQIMPSLKFIYLNLDTHTPQGPQNETTCIWKQKIRIDPNLS